MDLNELLNPVEVHQLLSRALGVSHLLNPDETPVDILPLVKELATYSENLSIPVPFEIQNHLTCAESFAE
jgi:hypothetical protein